MHGQAVRVVTGCRSGGGSVEVYCWWRANGMALGGGSRMAVGERMG